MKERLCGNEVFVRGAYEAGCLVASAYPEEHFGVGFDI